MFIQVISPEIERNVGKSLEKINFITLITDTSNRKADKMLPVMVRGFDEERGVQVFKLAVKLIPNERSETIGMELIGTGKNWKVEDKVVAFGADNCVTNFGGVNRNGENNVFFRLKKELGRDIVGIGCVAHIIHNAFDSACDQLPINIEALAVNIYKHFHIHTSRVETLKEFCADSEMEYTKLTNHSGTRFLTLHLAVKKVNFDEFLLKLLQVFYCPQIIRMFEPLKNYFEGLNNCPVMLQQFFSELWALFWLKFIESQLALSNQYVLQTESKKIASFEVAVVVFKLRDIINNRQQGQFIPAEAAELFGDLADSQQAEAKKYMDNFYSELIRYLLKWSRSLDGTEVFSWMSLLASPDWEKDVKPSLKFFQQHFSRDMINEDEAFDQTCLLRQYVNSNFPKWNGSNESSERRWIETFGSLKSQNRPIKQISLLVQYAFAIPGTSTEVERLFSVINDVWGPDKGQMLPKSLEALLNVKINSEQNCVEYYESIKSNKKLLAQVQSGDKYKPINASQPSTSVAYHGSEDDV